MRHPDMHKPGPTQRIATALENALPRAGRRARRAEKHSRAPKQMPVVASVSPNAGAEASMRYCNERIEQLLDRWTERDPATLAGAYYHDLLNLNENLLNLMGE